MIIRNIPVRIFIRESVEPPGVSRIPPTCLLPILPADYTVWQSKEGNAGPKVLTVDNRVALKKTITALTSVLF